MFDADYFAKRLPEDVRAMVKSVTVTLTLHTGVEVFVSRVATAEDGYVVLFVYPVDGGKPELRSDWRRAQELGEPIHEADRLAVAYEAISHVQLSYAPPKDAPVIGFKSA